jgi:phage terminase small subunit
MTTDVILQGKQPAFVALYVANEAKPEGERLTLHEVAVNAGYAPKSASVTASVLLSDPKIVAAIAERKRKLAEDALGLCDVDAKAVIQEWVRIAFADATRITHVRRLNCRHCYGFNFGYQRTDAEYARDVAEAMDDAQVAGKDADLSPFTGGPGFRHTRDPNPDCPECSGEGVEDVYIADMRKLPPELRRLVASVEQTRNGIKVTMRDQDEALQRIAQYLGLMVNKTELTGPGGGPVQTANVNYSLPSDPQEASRAYQMLMEGKK